MPPRVKKSKITTSAQDSESGTSDQTDSLRTVALTRRALKQLDTVSTSPAPLTTSPRILHHISTEGLPRLPASPIAVSIALPAKPIPTSPTDNSKGAAVMLPSSSDSPVPPVPPAPSSGDDIPELSEATITKIVERLAQLIPAASPSRTESRASTSNYPPPTQGVLPPRPPALPIGFPEHAGFLPPRSNNPAYGASLPSLNSMFPDLDDSLITSVINHTLRSEDLYKLDNRLDHSKEKPDFTVGSEGNLVLKAGTGTTKDYPTHLSLMYPLERYFMILTLHSAAVESPGWHSYFFHRYTANLIAYIAQYEWHAVRAYHHNFFNERREEMKQGYYSQWAMPDPLLQGEYLFPHVRAPATASKMLSGRKLLLAMTLRQHASSGTRENATLRASGNNHIYARSVERGITRSPNALPPRQPRVYQQWEPSLYPI